MQPGLLEQGLTLMLVGMGTVFVFLTLLVAATTLMSRLAARLSPAPVAESPIVDSPIVDDEIGDDEIAAISAAIIRHRQR